jgi:hypothetical protein
MFPVRHGLSSYILFGRWRLEFMTKLCTQQAEVIQNHENERVRSTGQGEARHRQYKRLKLGGGQALRPFKLLSCRCSMR